MRVRWPEPPQMSMARAARPEHRAARPRGPRRRRRRRSGRRSGRENSRPRSSGRAPRRRRGRWRCPTRPTASKRAACRVVVEAEHRAAREIGPAGLDVVARRRRRRLRCSTGMPSTTRKDAAVAAEDAVVDLVAVAPVEQRVDQLEAAAAVRAAQDVERRAHVQCGMGDRLARACSSSGVAAAGERRAPELFGAQPAAARRPRRASANGLFGPICVRWQRARRASAAPSRARRSTNVGGPAASPKASGAMPQKLGVGRRPALAARAASTTARMTPGGMVT